MTSPARESLRIAQEYEEVEGLDAAGVVHIVRRRTSRRRMSATGRFAVSLAVYVVVAAAVAIGFVLAAGLIGDTFGASLGLFGVCLAFLAPAAVVSALVLTRLTRGSMRPSRLLGSITAGAISAASLAAFVGLSATNAGPEPSFDLGPVVLLLALFGGGVGSIAGATIVGVERQLSRTPSSPTGG